MFKLLGVAIQSNGEIDEASVTLPFNRTVGSPVAVIVRWLCEVEAGLSSFETQTRAQGRMPEVTGNMSVKKVARGKGFLV